MAHPTQKRNCQHCKRVFHPDHRNVTRQRYCSKPECRHASKVDSQQRWRQKPENLDYFRGPDNGWNRNGIKLSSSSLRYQAFTQDMTGFVHERELLRSPLFNSRLIPIGT